MKFNTSFNLHQIEEKSEELEVNITNEFGTKFDFTDTEKFKEELYAYAMRVKKKIKEDIEEEKRESKAKKLK